MAAKLILNPYAGRWRARERRPEVEAALQNAGVAYELVESEAPEHCIQLAAEAVQAGFSPILAAGGDGTIGEIVNGLVLARGEKELPPLGLLPLGTANDLASNLEMSMDLNTAAEVIASGRTRLIDVCKVNERYFVNNAGLGLEPYITRIQQGMQRLRGVLRYLAATLTGIAHNPQWEVRLRWDSGEYEGPVTMISVGNAPRTGGIFYTVPNADPFDGKLSFAYGHIPTRLGILQVLPKAMRPEAGNYVEHPAVEEQDCKWLSVRMTPSTPAHADGELFAEAIEDLDYQILPSRLPILMA